MWLICYTLTATGYLDDAESSPLGMNVHLRVQLNQTANAKWFVFPYPGQFGPPKFNMVAFLGMIVGTMTSIIESVGDYHAASSVCGLGRPPKHAVNRGIMVEGLCGMLSGIMGAGHPTTSYSGNIGAIALTRVASRKVFYCAGGILIMIGVSGKLTAVLSSIPQPVVGGFMFIGLGLVISVGLSTLNHVDLQSPRNLAILGTSFMIGLVLPPWVQDLTQTCGLDTGYQWLDNIVTAFFGTSMFVGGFTACLLDNTVPGTRQERGMVTLELDDAAGVGGGSAEQFELPFLSRWLAQKRLKPWWLPVCPGYTGFGKKKQHDREKSCQDKDELYKCDAGSETVTVGQSDESEMEMDGGQVFVNSLP